MATGEWFHVAVIRDGAEKTIKFNGVGDSFVVDSSPWEFGTGDFTATSNFRQGYSAPLTPEDELQTAISNAVRKMKE